MDDLRMEISAKLTQALFEKAGLAVEIEKVWASMEMPLEEAMRLSLTDV
jgi:hypothetical protein